MGFVAALLLFTSLVTRGRAPIGFVVGVPIVVAAAGVAVIARNSLDVDMQALSFVHQFEGVPQSLVLMRGEIEHPSAKPLELAPRLDGGSVDIVRGLQRSDSTASADGRALYRNTAGRGVKQRFELNGTLDANWLAVERNGNEIMAANRSPLALSDCEMRSDDRVSIGAIPAGGTARIPVSTALRAGDSIVCRLPADWMPWSARSGVITTRGSAFLILHIWPGAAAARAGSDAAR
jgi:hypothetical protein